MFKITTKKELNWPVTISVPQDGGKVKKQETIVRFEHIDQSLFDANYATGGSDADLMKRVVIGWDDGQFQNEDGSSMPFSIENLAALLETSYVRIGFVNAYLMIQQGKEAARKN